jgi:hypothetical protein
MADRFVAVATSSGKVATSDDGINWTQRTSGFSGRVRCLTFGPVWLACDSSKVGWSNDGITWTLNPAPNAAINGFAWNGSLWVAVDDFGHIWRSSNGITWTEATTGIVPDFSQMADVCWDPYNNLFIAVGTDFTGQYGEAQTGIVVTSPDGISWTINPLISIAADIRSVTTDGAGTIVLAYASAFTVNRSLVSTDAGGSWNSTSLGYNISRIVHGDDIFMSVGASGNLDTSPDGLDWTSQDSTLSTTLSDAAFGPPLDIWVAVGSSGEEISSPDAETWTENDSSFGSTNINRVAFGQTSSYVPAFGFTADSVTRATIAGSFLADAEIVEFAYRVPTNAVIRKGQSQTFAADALIAFDISGTTTGRNPHDRGEQHFGTMPATMVAYDQTSTVEQKLRLIWERIASFESGYFKRSSVTADALFRKVRSATFTANSVIGGVSATVTGSWTGDAIVKRAQTGSAQANAVVRRTSAGSFTADAYIFVSGTGSFTADGILFKTRTGSFAADAVIDDGSGESGLLGDHILGQHRLGGE